LAVTSENDGRAKFLGIPGDNRRRGHQYHPVPTSRSYRRRAQIACGLLLLVIISGCSFLSGITGTESSLQDAGYRDVDVNIASGSGLPANGLVSLSYSHGPTGNGQRDARHAEQIVWDSLRYRFGALSIIKTSGGCDGPVCVSHSAVLDSVTYAGLAARLGPRPRGLDAVSATHAVRISPWAIDLGLAALLAGVTLTVTLVTKSRKRRPPVHPIAPR
jgi:hypothetical protein